MMGLAEGLPVAFHIPEQRLIALMGDDVIDHRGRGDAPFPFARDAEGMAHQVGLAGFLPAGVVASLSCAAPVLSRACGHRERSAHARIRKRLCCGVRTLRPAWSM